MSTNTAIQWPSVTDNIQPATVFQCGNCQRQFDETGAMWTFHRGETRWARQPEIKDCEQPDCERLTLEIAHREQQRIERRWARKKARATANQTDCRAKSSSARPIGRLPYKDSDADPRTLNDAKSADLYARVVEKLQHSSTPALQSLRNPDHRSEQHRFVAEGDGVSDCEKMLEILFGPPDTGFRPDDPTRTSRGPWVSSHDLKYVHGIETPNSRASQLRGSATLEAHPLVKRFDLDIDCRRNPAEYSVCFKEHSERLRVG